MDPNQLLKDHIKEMPVWEHVDKFRAELSLLEHDLKSYIERQNDRSKRISELPELNLTNKPRVLPPTARPFNDADIVHLYKKTTQGYELCHNQTPINDIPAKPKTDPVVASLKKLEEKIEANSDIWAMLKPGKPWIKCKVRRVFRRPAHEANRNGKPIVTFRLEAPPGYQPHVVEVQKYAVARVQNHSVHLEVGKRVIAGLADSTLLPGIIGQEPNDENKSRYLVLMDSGSASYFQPEHVYPIVWQSASPWLDGHYLGYKNPQTDSCLRHFFAQYPKRLLIMAPIGEKLELLRNGTLVSATIMSMDGDTMRVQYKDFSEESIYRGSPRLMKRTDVSFRHLSSIRTVDNFNHDLQLNFHAYHQAGRRALNEYLSILENFNEQVTISTNGRTARKSTTSKNPARTKIRLDTQLIQENRHEVEVLDAGRLEAMKSHVCSPSCLVAPGVETEASIGTDIIKRFRRVGDLKVPLLLGWKRQMVRVSGRTRSGNFKIAIIYEAPCGKIFDAPYKIRRYLHKTGSVMDIDYFSFERELELNRSLGEVSSCYYSENIAYDFKTKEPLENKFISLLNTFNEEHLPEDFEYRNETFPHPMLAAKGFSFNTEFKSSCDCEDNCFSRPTCACHQLNENAYGKKAHNRGTIEVKCQYSSNKRLQMQVNTGIFECNSGCKCNSKCNNRVVQNGIRFRLQVQKTLKKGWGVITLDDIPAGAFICTYSAELLDNADEYGDCDMYFADLDYLTVNEEQKENLSDSDKSDEGIDVSDSEEEVAAKHPKGKRKKAPCISESEGDDASISSLEIVQTVEAPVANGSANGDPPASGSRYPKRKNQQQQRVNNNGAQGSSRPSAPRYVKIHTLLNSHDFTLDARMQGNVGRFFNHSCDPNSFVQNVFIETHDLRFPVVSFFALRLIKAGQEITWNYNYKMMEGRETRCECGASNCKGRIL